jgi:hypothetical protein
MAEEVAGSVFDDLLEGCELVSPHDIGRLVAKNFVRVARRERAISDEGNNMNSIRRSSVASRAKAGAAIVVITMAALLLGCTTPDPNTPAGAAEIAGQKCTVCRAENPGDISPCYAICMQRVQDQGAIGR